MINLKRVLVVCLEFYSTCIKELHVDSKPLKDLMKNKTTFHWTDGHKNLLKEI